MCAVARRERVRQERGYGVERTAPSPLGTWPSSVPSRVPGLGEWNEAQQTVPWYITRPHPRRHANVGAKTRKFATQVMLLSLIRRPPRGCKQGHRISYKIISL